MVQGLNSRLLPRSRSALYAARAGQAATERAGGRAWLLTLSCGHHAAPSIPRFSAAHFAIVLDGLGSKHPRRARAVQPSNTWSAEEAALHPLWRGPRLAAARDPGARLEQYRRHGGTAAQAAQSSATMSWMQKSPWNGISFPGARGWRGGG